MGNYKEHMNKHLVSAKEWVSRAEQSFETEKDIRGELDLLLAQAELAHVQKASRLHRLIQYPFFKQSAALVVALFAVVFGLGTSYWLNAHLPEQQPGITVSGTDLPSNYPIPKSNDTLLNKGHLLRPDNVLPPQGSQALKLPDNTPGQPPALTKEAAENSAAAASAHLAPQPERSYSPAPVSVSREQMQTLIRSAGNSLRGRE